MALDYVRRHRAGFDLDEGDLDGLRLVRSYRFGRGTTHLQWEQSYRGIPVFGFGLRANVDADGRLINIGDGARPDPAVASTEPRLSALDALLATARAAHVAVVPGRPGEPVGAERATTFANGQRAGLTVFGDRLAWRVLVRGAGAQAYDAVVDAAGGETLYRVSLVKEAGAIAFDNYPGAPQGGTQLPKTFSEAGTDPWLTELPTPARLFGTNAHVYSDPDDTFGLAGPDTANEIPPSGGAWNHGQVTSPATSPGQLCPPAGCTWNDIDNSFSWTVNRAQAGTQLFYFVNTFHDHLRDAAGIGFDNSSGNFEGSDRVIGQVDDGANTDGGFPDCNHTNNAFVIPVPDGTPLPMQIYLWSGFCVPGLHDVNAADDALIVYHEYTHGLTNRLVTDAGGMPALNGPQAGAMDEGFADWYAFDMLNGRGLEPDSAAPGELRLGRYENDALRTQPIDCPVGAPPAACPGTAPGGSGGYTYGDFAKILGDDEVHADGEIWVETLWDLRTRLIADHGAAGGIARARALVTDGLRLAPANPSFLAMRNAILQADVNRGYGDSGRIWAVFARRGMGVRAQTSGTLDEAPIQDFSVPSGPSPPPPRPPADDSAPSISRLSMSKRRFKVGQGVTFTFRISEPATSAHPDRPVRGGPSGGPALPAAQAVAAPAPALHPLPAPGSPGARQPETRRPAHDAQAAHRVARRTPRALPRDDRVDRCRREPLARRSA